MLLVKRFAFDLELLAVSRALGFGRIEELPVRLDYRFTGPERRVARRPARPRRHRSDLLPAADSPLLRAQESPEGRIRVDSATWHSSRSSRCSPSTPEALAGVDYPRIEVISIRRREPGRIRELAKQARGSVLALLEQGSPGGKLDLGDGPVPSARRRGGRRAPRRSHRARARREPRRRCQRGVTARRRFALLQVHARETSGTSTTSRRGSIIVERSAISLSATPSRRRISPLV